MTMLDLNVDLEDSGTSNSSVVNLEESRDEDSSAAFEFDILKRETEGAVKKEEKATREIEITTGPLFPVTGGGDEKLGLCSTSNNQWLNLWFAEGNRQSDLRILQQKQPQIRKNRRGPRSRSSQYRGVTFYRRTGRWESHIWDCGKQVYLGGFDTAHAAARAYDRAVIKFRGVDADINFSLSDYEEDLKQMRNLSKEEFVQVLRRHCSGISRGSSKSKGVYLHKWGQWEARMSSFLGKKIYDKLPIKCDGRGLVTSFEPSRCKTERSVESSRGGELEKLCVINNNCSNKLAAAIDAGSFHNLDLSLGISPPSESKKQMVESTGPALIRGQAIYGLAMTSKYDQIRSGIYPGYVQNYEKMTLYQTFPWQLQNNGSIAPVPVLSSAASSKFNSCSNIDSSAPLPINPHNYKLCFSSTTTSTINSPSCRSLRS